MAVSLILIAALAIGGLMIRSARSGASSRGAYLGAALIVAVIGYGVEGLRPTSREVVAAAQSGDFGHASATEFMFMWARAVAYAFYVVAAGGVLAAAFYRPDGPPAATKPCPFCAEPIRVAAKVCKHCQRTLDAAPSA